MKLLNEADIKNFYNWLNHKKHGYTEVNIIKPKIIYPNGEKIEGKMFATGFFNNAEDVLSICQRYSGFQDPADNRFVMLYIGVNPRKKELFDLSPNKLDFKQKPSASDNHIAAYINGYIDCDHADDSKQAVTLEEVRLTEKAANHISDWFKAKGFIQPAPGMSGNGWQLHYAVPAIGPEDNLSELKGKLKTFSRQIQEECKMNGVRIDSTFEPRRIAKLFGTLSTKGEPELHRLTTWSSNVRYEDEKLRDYIISLSPYDDSRNLSISIQIDSKQALDPYFLKLIKHDQAINKLWNKGINNDRSKTDYSLVSQLVEYGITEEIKLCKILYDAPHGKASSYPDPPKYIAGLLSKFAPPKIHMMDINNALYATKRVSAEVMIASIGETYTVPKEVKYKCTKNTLCKNAGNCLLSRGPVTKILRANDRRLIDLTKIRDSKRDRIILGILNLSCNEIHLAYEIKEYVSIQEMVVIPKARITKMVKKDSSNIMLDEIGREFREKVVYFMGTSPQSNKYFTATGWVMPSPKGQEATMLINEMTLLADDYENFILTDEIKKNFSFFQAASEGLFDEDGVACKVNEITADITDNITNIYGQHRQNVLLGDLITFHSIIEFEFDGEILKRSVVEHCKVGDTGEGKTQIVERVVKATNLGEIVDGVSSSRTGISYSFQKFGDSWYLLWGKYPLNDGKLLIVDEAHMLKAGDIDNMRKGRSEGVMSASGVKSGEHNSRTRLIFICNPKKDEIIDDEMFGVETLKDILKDEDIRRLDFAVFLSGSDQSADEVNILKSARSKVEQNITPEILHDSICWAWTRRREHVVFTSEAEIAVVEVAKRLNAKYGAARDIPLCGTDIRHKVARLSVALAALLHSTDDTHEKVIVHDCHPNHIEKYLHCIYDAKNGSFDKYAKIKQQQSALDDEKYTEFLTDIKEEVNVSKDDKPDSAKIGDLIHEILKAFIGNRNGISRTDLAETLGITKKWVSTKIGVLRKHKMIQVRRGRGGGYVATAKMNKVLKRMMEENLLEL